MSTECSQEPFPFHPLNQREIRGQFDGGSITSDAGGLLLREVEKRTNIIGQFASCFSDYRDPELVEHGVAELLAQRIYGLALGYEDLNDHEELRRDPLLAVLVEKEDLTVKQRRGGGSDAGGYFFASVRSHSNCLVNRLPASDTGNLPITVRKVEFRLLHTRLGADRVARASILDDHTVSEQSVD